MSPTRLSPRTWGWTENSSWLKGFSTVVPTHVGVDRCQGGQGRRPGCCPHARGGGPRPRSRRPPRALLSPRTWGWTSDVRRGVRPRRVVPTHVGVDRVGQSRARRTTGCPHARGGGPRRFRSGVGGSSLSPRTWGWTERGTVGVLVGGVVPTHVGVDRSPRATGCRAACCPHARGGGPSLTVTWCLLTMLSPRTWGWTPDVGRVADGVPVVPTHVGVDPGAASRRPAPGRCPHARGGGPRARATRPPRMPLSPRTWGWTQPVETDGDHGIVVPTHVGVDPSRARKPTLNACCPHARGGGPRRGSLLDEQRRLSPRTWGWTQPGADRLVR